MENAYQRTRYWKDDSGELAKIAEQCITDDFALHRALKILYAWRDPPRYDQSRNRIVQGEVKKLATRERDLYGYDTSVIIARKLWKEMNEKQRYKLMWHELNHIEVRVDDTGKPEKDDFKRVKIKYKRHDLNMERFSEEIEKFGPDASERTQMRKISKLYRKFKEKP